MRKMKLLDGNKLVAYLEVDDSNFFSLFFKIMHNFCLKKSFLLNFEYNKGTPNCNAHHLFQVGKNKPLYKDCEYS